MRSSKYHDYRVLKIALFIILVVLGLFIYIKCIRAPLEHTAPDNAWKVLTEATCTTDGQRCKVCTECGEEFDHESIPATGHDTYWKTAKEATCTEDGLSVKACKNCKETFDTEGIKATGHTESKSPVVKNYVASTCTVGGSYDNVYFCTVCKKEASRETVQMDPTGHKPGEPEKENINDSTHTNSGTYDLATYCVSCDEKLSSEPKVIDPKGHSYTWELKYNEETDTFTMVGTCDCDETGNVSTKTADDGLVVVQDTSVATCCINRKIGKITIDGQTYTDTIDLPVVEPHKIHKVEENGTVTYIPVTDFRNYDEELGIYYYNTDLEGIIVPVKPDWDENGYALGAYKCVLCEDKHCTKCQAGDNQYYYAVWIYNPDKDTRTKNDI